MTLIRWTPAAPRTLSDVRNEMDRLFDSFLSTRSLPSTFGTIAPPVDIEETPEAFVLTADLPGADPKQIKVTLTNGVLTLRGERRVAKSATEGALHRTERASGSFERSFTLGTPVRADQIKATYRDGVLEVRIPKADEAREREIEVQVG
ncbi:MAG: Hsp20/alpha crystallin family protein [Candidatus Eisenbacteria bacterium]|uniref:Hsp20/alpha crystallin family protein n=1 Tax=Eiseniibacteriota bacterium TaxID=2212470 RepID=A0A933WCD4_UNCEI|nr:Hsp20/alpha crystallin family protein [Candidatus Eisenbacteria bacterium]